MSEDYFKQALGDFVTDFAVGGAVRRLADKGYSAEEIKKHLDYPVTDAKIEEIIRKHNERKNTGDNTGLQ